MPRKRTIEPIGPTTIPGEPLDPKIPPELEPEPKDIQEETDVARQSRDSEEAFDKAIVRPPPG
jgi:hypothetical protein